GSGASSHRTARCDGGCRRPGARVCALREARREPHRARRVRLRACAGAVGLRWRPRTRAGARGEGQVPLRRERAGGCEAQGSGTLAGGARRVDEVAREPALNYARGIAGGWEPMKKSVPKSESASARIDERIKDLGDWRGKALAKVRKLVKEADPE